MELDREAMLNKILGSANAQFGLVDRWETELHDESRRRDVQAHAIARAQALSTFAAAILLGEVVHELAQHRST